MSDIELANPVSGSPAETKARDILRLTALGFEVPIGGSNLAELAAALATEAPALRDFLFFPFSP
jgi:hypothetical protein